MKCRGINRKNLSLMTDFGKFGFQSMLQKLGILEKKIESRLGFASKAYFLKSPLPAKGIHTINLPVASNPSSFYKLTWKIEENARKLKTKKK